MLGSYLDLPSREEVKSGVLSGLAGCGRTSVSSPKCIFAHVAVLASESLCRHNTSTRGATSVGMLQSWPLPLEYGCISASDQLSLSHALRVARNKPTFALAHVRTRRHISTRAAGEQVVASDTLKHWPRTWLLRDLAASMRCLPKCSSSSWSRSTTSERLSPSRACASQQERSAICSRRTDQTANGALGSYAFAQASHGPSYLAILSLGRASHVRRSSFPHRYAACSSLLAEQAGSAAGAIVDHAAKCMHCGESLKRSPAMLVQAQRECDVSVNCFRSIALTQLRSGLCRDARSDRRSAGHGSAAVRRLLQHRLEQIDSAGETVSVAPTLRSDAREHFADKARARPPHHDGVPARIHGPAAAG